MNSWGKTRIGILKNIGNESAAEISTRKWLQSVLVVAEELDIPCSAVEGINPACFRVILSKARAAAARRDRQELEDLFDMAKTMPMYDLRIAVGNRERPVIEAVQLYGPSVDVYTLTVSRETLLSLARTSRSQYNIVVPGGHNDIAA